MSDADRVRSIRISMGTAVDSYDSTDEGDIIVLDLNAKKVVAIITGAEFRELAMWVEEDEDAADCSATATMLMIRLRKAGYSGYESGEILEAVYGACLPGGVGTPSIEVIYNPLKREG